MNGDEPEVLHASLADGLTRPPDDPVLRHLASALTEAGGGTVGAILLYGSHLHESTPNRWSAYDFVVVVDSYGPFYASLRARGLVQKPTWLMTGLSQYLPPNLIAFDPGRPDGAIAKCAVFRTSHFRRALALHAPDHFLKGRVAQRIALAWCRDPEAGALVEEAVAQARGDVPRWVRPYLDGPFDLETFAETMLRVSYGAEIRPEHGDRVAEVFAAQKEALMSVALASLRAAEKAGVVTEVDGVFRWVTPPGFAARIGRSAYFTWSKVRATARWGKYILTFDDWLEYIAKKLERRAGLKVEVRESERRWPLLLLWPKLFRILRILRQTRSSHTPPKEVGGR